MLKLQATVVSGHRGLGEGRTGGNPTVDSMPAVGGHHVSCFYARAKGAFLCLAHHLNDSLQKASLLLSKRQRSLSEAMCNGRSSCG